MPGTLNLRFRLFIRTTKGNELAFRYSHDLLIPSRLAASSILSRPTSGDSAVGDSRAGGAPEGPGWVRRAQASALPCSSSPISFGSSSKEAFSILRKSATALASPPFSCYRLSRCCPGCCLRMYRKRSSGRQAETGGEPVVERGCTVSVSRH